MNLKINVQNILGGDQLNTNHIELNQVVYEVHRVYKGKKTVANLVRERLGIQEPNHTIDTISCLNV